MSFRGFYVESKSFLNYPHCGKWYFWSRFPFKWIGFVVICYCDQHEWAWKLLKKFKKVGR